MNPKFSEASFFEFRKVFKKECYAWMCGSYSAEQISNDMLYCYMMGHEL